MFENPIISSRKSWSCALQTECGLVTVYLEMLYSAALWEIKWSTSGVWNNRTYQKMIRRNKVVVSFPLLNQSANSSTKSCDILTVGHHLAPSLPALWGRRNTWRCLGCSLKVCGWSQLWPSGQTNETTFTIKLNRSFQAKCFQVKQKQDIWIKISLTILLFLLQPKLHVENYHGHKYSAPLVN